MRARLVLVTFLTALLAFAAPRCARAQVAPSEIEVRVTDAAHKPLADARVFISGALTTSALTPRDGKLRFTDVEPGLYRLRIALAGYTGVDVDDVEALAGRRKIVEITLERVLPKGAAPARHACGRARRAISKRSAACRRGLRSRSPASTSTKAIPCAASRRTSPTRWTRSRASP